MSKLAIVSDLHSKPNDTLRHIKLLSQCMRHCTELEKGGYKTIIAGDAHNVLEYGLNKILSDASSRMLWEWCNDSNKVRLKGNHDPDPKFPSFIVVDGYYICHGHQFDYLWSWLPIYRLHLPYFLSRKITTPAKKKEHGIQDYWVVTRGCEHEATKYMVKHNYKGVVFGHTHCPVEIKRNGYTLLNSGDWVDSYTILLLNTETGEHSILPCW